MKRCSCHQILEKETRIINGLGLVIEGSQSPPKSKKKSRREKGRDGRQTNIPMTGAIPIWPSKDDCRCGDASSCSSLSLSLLLVKMRGTRQSPTGWCFDAEEWKESAHRQVGKKGENSQLVQQKAQNQREKNNQEGVAD